MWECRQRAVRILCRQRSSRCLGIPLSTVVCAIRMEPMGPQRNPWLYSCRQNNDANCGTLESLETQPSISFQSRSPWPSRIHHPRKALHQSAYKVQQEYCASVRGKQLGEKLRPWMEQTLAQNRKSSGGTTISAICGYMDLWLRRLFA